MVLETYMKLCVTETENGPKTGFFEFIEKFGQ